MGFTCNINVSFTERPTFSIILHCNTMKLNFKVKSRSLLWRGTLTSVVCIGIICVPVEFELVSRVHVWK